VAKASSGYYVQAAQQLLGCEPPTAERDHSIGVFVGSMPGVAHMASLKIVLEREKTRKKKTAKSPFEQYMSDLVDSDRPGAYPTPPSRLCWLVPPPNRPLLAPHDLGCSVTHAPPHVPALAAIKGKGDAEGDMEKQYPWFYLHNEWVDLHAPADGENAKLRTCLYYYDVLAYGVNK
jgi:hypothetical protein